MRTSRSGESALLLVDVVDLLVAKQIEYAVVGAIAASVHGAVRASMDADVVLSLAIGKASDLERSFKAAGFNTALSRGDFDDPIPGLLDIVDATRAIAASGDSLDKESLRRLAGKYGRDAAETLERLLAS
jgi:hypothetical protein